MPPDTTVAFFAREEGRSKAPPALLEAVKKAGGAISADRPVQPWGLARRVRERARQLGLEMEPAAAQALISHVGERQQRLQRELETLALEVGPGAQVDADAVEER